MHSVISMFMRLYLGKDWGESGYIRILRGANICGFGSLVYQPVVSAIATTVKSIPITTSSNASQVVLTSKIFFFVLFLYTACL